jgi:hypothetical protein
MITYQFDAQMRRGDAGEAFLDDFFRQRGYTISPVSREDQRRGVDRLFISPRTGKQHRVEYKTDHTAGRTGNAFIETVSVDASGKMGWALTAQADMLIYYIPPSHKILIIPFTALHWELPRWIRDYPPRQAANHTYATHGIIIPLAELEQHALRVYRV